jgi:hypothetical protein
MPIIDASDSACDFESICAICCCGIPERLRAMRMIVTVEHQQQPQSIDWIFRDVGQQGCKGGTPSLVAQEELFEIIDYKQHRCGVGSRGCLGCHSSVALSFNTAADTREDLPTSNAPLMLLIGKALMTSWT